MKTPLSRSRASGADHGAHVASGSDRGSAAGARLRGAHGKGRESDGVCRLPRPRLPSRQPGPWEVASSAESYVGPVSWLRDLLLSTAVCTAVSECWGDRLFQSAVDPRSLLLPHGALCVTPQIGACSPWAVARGRIWSSREPESAEAHAPRQSGTRQPPTSLPLCPSATSHGGCVAVRSAGELAVSEGP